jgi:hypothetical protein
METRSCDVDQAMNGLDALSIVLWHQTRTIAVILQNCKLSHTGTHDAALKSTKDEKTGSGVVQWDPERGTQD